MKTLAIATALVVGGSTLALAQSPSHYYKTHRYSRTHKVLANGRCNGVSYGTGQRGCGTATGGTPGGNPSRN